MELKLYFSEEEMREFLKKHMWLSIEVDAWDSLKREKKVEVFWKAGIKPDMKKWQDRHIQDLSEYSLRYVFAQEMKYQLLKL